MIERVKIEKGSCMMQGITVKELTEVLGGRLLCGEEMTEIKTLSFDSRQIKEKTLYVPLPGEHVDGHQFISSAFQNKAVATLTTKGKIVEVEKPHIQVEDCKRALQLAGAYFRKKKAIPIVGITGSVGKTTTRSLVAEALSAKKTVFQTKGNLNSQIGVPVMLSEIAEEEMAVLEMGISEFGEMERLTNIVHPDLAVITCIGVAHIRQLESQENICKEKMKITLGMEENRILLLNGDDPLLRAGRNSVKNVVLLYGTTPDCDFYAKEIRIVEGKAVFRAVCLEEEVEVILSMPGMHNVLNAMAALAVCKLYQVPLKQAAKKLEQFGGVSMRQQVIITKKYTIIDDTYNANPDSMKAGIRVLMELPKEGRKIAVLGDMLELGEEEQKYHQEIGRFAADIGVDLLLTVGNLTRDMEEAALREGKGIQVKHFQDNKQIAAYLKELLLPEDVVLLKGSRGMALDQVVKELCIFAECSN